MGYWFLIPVSGFVAHLLFYKKYNFEEISATFAWLCTAKYYKNKLKLVKECKNQKQSFLNTNLIEQPI